VSAKPCRCDPEMGWTCDQCRLVPTSKRLPPRDPPPTETLIVDSKTGGVKAQKDDRYDLIPPEFLQALALHYGRGARKYADRNWEQGYGWHLSLRAVFSHLMAWLLGEREDPETKTHHLICSAWHLIALYTFDTRRLGTDTVTCLSGTPKAEGRS
jgi:hypothetical protein